MCKGSDPDSGAHYPMRANRTIRPGGSRPLNKPSIRLVAARPARVDHSEALRVVGESIDSRLAVLEEELLGELAAHTQEAIGARAAALGTSLHERLTVLERSSAVRSWELSRLGESAGKRQSRMDAVGEAIRRIVQTTSQTPPLRSLAAAPFATAVAQSRHSCPQCSSTDVYFTDLRGLREHLLLLLFMHPLICRQCGRRFCRVDSE